MMLRGTPYYCIQTFKALPEQWGTCETPNSKAAGRLPTEALPKDKIIPT